MLSSAGAGGLELATRLGKTLGKRGKASVTLVDANLTHIWKPLLHEVAAGSLNSSEDELNYVAQAKWNHFQFQLGRMSGLDRELKKISLSATLDENGQELVPARELGYDTLVIAVGSTTNDFGTKGAAEHCLLDTRKQAEKFHQQLLNHYLRAHAGQRIRSNRSAWPLSAQVQPESSWLPNCTMPPTNWQPMAWTGSSRKTCISP